MAGSGVATTREGKGMTLDVVSSLLEKSDLLFSIPSARITANEMVAFRKGLPDGCTAKVVKNTLMRRASVGTGFEQVVDISKGENMWIFVEGEENLAQPINYVTGFGKDNFDKDRVRVMPLPVDSDSLCVFVKSTVGLSWREGACFS